MSNRNLIILLIGMCIWISCNTLWLYFGQSVYYYGVASMIAASSLVINNQAIGKRKIVSELFVFFAFNNLIDEIFFDPQAIEFNEYFTSCLMIIFLIWKFLKPRSSTENQ